MAWEPSYVTDNEFKSYIKIELNDTADDTFIALDIAAASRAIDKCCSSARNGLGFRRQFGQVAAPEVRYYTPRWDSDLMQWVIEMDDLMDSTGFTVEIDTSNLNNYDQTVSSSFYVFRPRSAAALLRPWTQLAILATSSVQPTYYKDSAKLTGRWGWSAVPDVIKRATLIQAHRFNKRRSAPFGVAGSPQRQTETSILDQLDPDVEQMLISNDFIRLGWTA